MSSPSISFDTIPASIRKPGVYTEINTSLAVRTLPENATPVVILGQRTASGSIAANTLQTVFSDADSALYFGAGSTCHKMTLAALTANPYLDLDVVAMDDAAGQAAQGIITLLGTATAAGTVNAYVDGYEASAVVAVGDSASTVATALATDINVHSAYLAVTGTSAGSGATGIITLVSKNKGTCGNFVPLTCSTVPAGLTKTVTAMTSGATDPDVGTAASGTLATIAGAGHSIVVVGLIDATNLAKMKTYIDFVSNSVEQRPAIAVYGYTDLVGSLANAKTLGGTTMNHGRSTIGYLQSPTTTDLEVSNVCVAAAYGAVIASESDPARPLNGLTLAGVPAPNVADRLTRTQQEDLLDNGVTPLIVDAAENVSICRAISTYVTNAAGITDPSLLDITTIRTLDYVRLATRTRLALRFPRSKLSARTPDSVKAEVMDVLRNLEQLEILENVEANKDGVIVERDTQDANRLDIRIPSDVVNGLHVIAERIDLIL